jgi:transposase
MIRPSNSSLKVYLYNQPVDMRKSMNGLSGLVEQQMNASPFSKSLFVFTNKGRDKLKILYWEKNGFVVWYKRLEKERFTWFKDENPKSISVKELNFLLDGYDVFKFRPHQPLYFDSVA